MANYIKQLQEQIVAKDEEIDDLREHIEAFKTIARSEPVSVGSDELLDEIQRLTAENAKLKRKSRQRSQVEVNPNVWYRG